MLLVIGLMIIVIGVAYSNRRALRDWRKDNTFIVNVPRKKVWLTFAPFLVVGLVIIGIHFYIIT